MSNLSTTANGRNTGSELDLPSIEQIISDFPGKSTFLPPRDKVTLPRQKQEQLLHALGKAIESFEGEVDVENNFDLEKLYASLEQAEGNYTLQSVPVILGQLWQSNSELLIEAAEVLANGSRDPSNRAPFGQSGILNFFLGIIESKDDVDTRLLLHSLRLVGNSCADTDTNRETVVKNEHISSIIQHILNPELVHVVIPVIYNICMDFEPAHAQIAVNKTAYILLKLLKDGAMEENDALLGFTYDLIELASEQAQGIEKSPDGTILLLTKLAQNEDLIFEYYSPLVNSLAKYLEAERFRTACVSNHLVEGLLSVLLQSFSVEIDNSSAEETKALAQLRLKITQSLAEVSASPLFAEEYPLDSTLSQMLKSWIVAEEDQLQVCACVMLGNLARSDEVCQLMVRDLEMHKELIAVLNSEARGAVLHSALGFLKNLAIAGDNRVSLAEAGIIPAVSRLWDFESVPQVQFAAATVTRLIVISSMDNIARLLARASQDPNVEPDQQSTLLSLLLALFKKTDSSPIKTEIGRTVASMCRTLSPKARAGDEQAVMLLDKLYGAHEDVARPIGAMITQTQWPVVRSEGWFALALMATNTYGCAAVADCLRNGEVMDILKSTMGATPAGQENTEDKDNPQITKDLENVFVLIQELLKNESDILAAHDRSMFEDWAREYTSRHLKNGGERSGATQ